MRREEILAELADLRAEGLSDTIYFQLVKMVESGLAEGIIVIPYLQTLYEMGFLSDLCYSRIFGLFVEDYEREIGDDFLIF
ncbi:MAG: hypothetical protein GXO19_06680 [Epsilonproteobacteria bacterium]|nr:hypothetical protein [Campylobacterota bacterium]NPA57402.1 hypothetical protein [Campylobacterota bacterium]